MLQDGPEDWMFGLLLNAENMTRLVDKGPSGDSKAEVLVLIRVLCSSSRRSLIVWAAFLFERVRNSRSSGARRPK